MAKLEHNLGISATYYFRIIPSVYKEEIIKQIQELGHEVSYHYEDLSLMKGNYYKAIKHFEFQLKRFRKFAPAKTICRHGSPLSKWDNKKLWERYLYYYTFFHIVNFKKVVNKLEEDKIFQDWKAANKDAHVHEWGMNIEDMEEVIEEI